MRDLVETGVLGFFILAALWIYGAMIDGRLHDMPKDERTRVVRRFRYGGALLAAVSFAVGLLYRAHMISFSVAIAMYIPLTVCFVLGLRWLQPYLQFHKGDINHE